MGPGSQKELQGFLLLIILVILAKAKEASIFTYAKNRGVYLRTYKSQQYDMIDCQVSNASSFSWDQEKKKNPHTTNLK